MSAGKPCGNVPTTCKPKLWLRLNPPLSWMEPSNTIKPQAILRQIQAADGVMIIDDSISEKPFSDENDIVCWHYDHAHGRVVKGINFLSCLYQVADISLPVGFEVIAKTETYLDKMDGKQKRHSPVTKKKSIKAYSATPCKIKFRFAMCREVFFANDYLV